METTALLPNIPFMTSKFYLKDLYGISMNDEDFIEKAMLVMKEINTYNRILYTYDVTMEDDFMIYIPHDNIHYIQSVSCITGTDSDVENTLRFIPENLSERAQTGEFVEYQLLDDNTIKVTNQLTLGKRVRVIFSGILEDNDHLPMLNIKQAKAIGARVAYMDTMKRAFMGDPNASNLLQFIQQESIRLVSAAKIPEVLTDNELNKICDTKVSHNRKVYGIPLKYTR